MRPDDGRVVSNFINQALRGEPITVYGDGSQTRSFCYVDDLVDGIFRLLMSDEVDPVNIGNPHETTIGEFAEEVAALVGASAGGTRSRVVYEPLPADDPKVRQPDITRAQQILGWEPTVSLDEGLRRLQASMLPKALVV
jgi:dTDP-glucose 4,6-dehydratase